VTKLLGSLNRRACLLKEPVRGRGDATRALRELAEGRSVTTRAHRRAAGGGTTERADLQLDTLTPREQEILA